MGTKVKTSTDYPSVEEVFSRLMQADPENGKNCVWIFKQYKWDLFHLEDIERVKEDLKIFIANEQGLPLKERSIENYNYSELKQVIKQFEPKFIPIEETEGDETILYSGEYGKLVIPRTREASCRLGAGTKWCTAARAGNRFEHYNKEGPLYIWIDFKRGKEKFQFHFGEKFQAMDELDNRINEELLNYYRSEHPILSLLFKEKEKEIMKDPKRASNYAINAIKGRWPEAEEYIMQDPNSAYKYAKDVIKRRWLDAEPYIMQDPESAANYAKEVIKGRWLEAEPYIMQNTHSAYIYAKYVIKGRWLDAEPYIMQDPRSAYNYAKEVIKGRWLGAEAYIMRNPQSAYEYARYFIRERWPEAEPYIMQDPKYAYSYAISIMKGRWMEAEPYIMQNPEYAYKYAKYVIKGRWLDAESYIIQDPTNSRSYELEFNIKFIKS